MTDETTPITFEVNSQSVNDTSEEPKPPEEKTCASSSTLLADDNDSDCQSNTTSSSALTALSNSKSFSTSKQQAYDNPCLSEIAESGGELKEQPSKSPPTVSASVSMPTSLKHSAGDSQAPIPLIDNSNKQSNNSITSPSKKSNNGSTSAKTPAVVGNNGSSSGTANGMHSRADSWMSGSGITSGTQTVCHSRGASTDASTIDVLSSATDSRRGTYSEAGTLPIGSLPEGSLGGTIIEEESTDRQSDKKLSSTQSLTGEGEMNLNNSRRSVKTEGRKCCYSCCDCVGPIKKKLRPIMQKHNTLPLNPSRIDQFKYSLTCPPHGKVGELLTYLLLALLSWGALYAITGDAAAPGGHLFSLLVVFVCSVTGGKLSQSIGLPPLLGMLLVGIALRNIPGIKIIGDGLNPEWSSSLRNIALVVILLRAGLGLDPVALKKLSFVVFRLAFTPCIVETAAVAVATHFLLDFPWLWGLMLGFILAAVSPAVVVPCLLNLSNLGYGVAKGIPTLVIAAASIDDVLAISGFGLTLGLTFSKGSLVQQIFHGPFEVLLGITYGTVFGLLCWILPNKRHKNSYALQFAMLLSAGLFALFGSQKTKFGGAGALAVLTMAFIAGIGFRKHGWGEDDNPVGQHCSSAWTVMQPLLFALIGTEIQIANLQADTIWAGLATLSISLTCRVLTTFFVVFGSGLNLRERIFVALAWLPKATVQAAIGSSALNYALSIGADEKEINYARQVLTIAVLVILITAPLGAIAIMSSAPRLLQRERKPEDTEGIERHA